MAFDWTDGPFEYIEDGVVKHKNVIALVKGNYADITTASGKHITTVYAETGSTTSCEESMHLWCVRKMQDMSDFDDQTLADKLRKLDAEYMEVYEALAARDYRFFDEDGEEIEFITPHRIYRYETILKEL